MLREAAEALDLSSHTLRRYIADNIDGLRPSKSVMFGKIEVYLYTPDDIKRMKEVLDNRVVIKDYSHSGRPSKYSLEERKDRARLFSRRHYWRKVQSNAIFFEDTERYAKARQEIEQIDRELENNE